LLGKGVFVETQDTGIIGLAVKGENLSITLESRGFSVAVFNRTQEKVDRFTVSNAEGKKL